MKHTFRKSSLISSIALLLVAVVALSGATFAWFSTNGKAKASGIKATTTQSSNLVISDKQDEGWTQDLILNVNKDLIPVTTDNLSAWYTANADSFNAQVAGKNGYSDASADNYIKKTIYVMYDATEIADDDPENAQNDKKTLTATLTATAKEGTTTDFYRVAIAPVAGTTGESGNGLSNTTVTDPIYFSPSAANHVSTATYGKYASNVTTNVEIPLGTLDAQDVYAFDVYVWFEGEDLDCKDSYSANEVDLVIDFA